MIEQALRVANKLGLSPAETARLLVGIESKPKPELRRAVLLVDDIEYRIGLMGRESAPPLVMPVDYMAFSDKPRGRRRGQRRGLNTWD